MYNVLRHVRPRKSFKPSFLELCTAIMPTLFLESQKSNHDQGFHQDAKINLAGAIKVEVVSANNRDAYPDD